uniref:Uncharacterized protein n=1 Tax=Peronospora matthiolae TaxID=2874970 RepID=A0AAV1T6U0_9STRA
MEENLAESQVTKSKVKSRPKHAFIGLGEVKQDRARTRPTGLGTESLKVLEPNHGVTNGPSGDEASLVVVDNEGKNFSQPMSQYLRSKLGIVVEQSDRAVVAWITSIPFLEKHARG